MASLPRGLAQHLLDQTTVDEAIVAAASGPAEKAKDFTASAIYTTSKSIQNIDYHTHYKSFVAPHVDAAGSVVYANLGPHLESMKASGAFDAASSAYETISPHVVRAGSTAFTHSKTALNAAPGLFSHVLAALEKVVDGVFKFFARVSPESAETLPTEFYDRLFLLVLSVVMLFNFYIFAKWAWRLVKVILRIKKFIIKIIVKPIWKVSRFAFGCACCLGSCCYCCGLCRKAKNGNKTDDKAKAGAKTNGEHKKATVDQVAQILQKSKDKGKLNDGVKSLAKTAKTGQPLQAPPDMKGMIITKDTLKQALKKFKEIDVKVLDL